MHCCTGTRVNTVLVTWQKSAKRVFTPYMNVCFPQEETLWTVEHHQDRKWRNEWIGCSYSVSAASFAISSSSTTLPVACFHSSPCGIDLQVEIALFKSLYESLMGVAPSFKEAIDEVKNAAADLLFGLELMKALHSVKRQLKMEE